MQDIRAGFHVTACSCASRQRLPRRVMLSALKT